MTPPLCPQHQLTLDPAGSYAVDDLKPDTVYVFSLAARSEKGLGVSTAPVEARTAQSSESRCNVHVVEGTDDQSTTEAELVVVVIVGVVAISSSRPPRSVHLD